MKHEFGDVIALDYVVITVILAFQLSMFIIERNYNYALAFYFFVQLWIQFLNLKTFEKVMLDIDIENRSLRSNVESICSALDYQNIDIN